MNTIDFCFWLQGFFEVTEATEVTPKQVEMIKNHLNLVFKHEIDPLRESQTTASVDELNHAHTPIPIGINKPPYTSNPMNDPLVRC